MKYPLMIRVLHLGLLVFGIAAYFTGDMAGDIRHGVDTGYLLHAYLGMSVGLFLLGRLAYGTASPDRGRLPFRVLYERRGRQTVREDIGQLRRLVLPLREDHAGISAVVHSFGLLVFLWMAVTGTAVFFLGGPEASLFAHALAEIHEASSNLIPVYLFLHLGAVMLYTLLGHHVWRRISPGFGETGTEEED